MKNTQKGSVLVWVIVIIILVLGGIYIYQTNKTSDSSEISNEVSNLKTYKNEEIGYEIKYPGDWTAREHSKSFVSIVSPKYPGKDDTDVPYENVSVSLGKDDCVPMEWKRGGQPAGDVNDSFKTACVEENKKIVISLFSMEESSRAVEDQILSTFKFTK